MGTLHSMHPCSSLQTARYCGVQLCLGSAGGSKAAKLPDPDLSAAANILPESSAAPARGLGRGSTKHAQEAALSDSDNDTGPSEPAAGKPLCPKQDLFGSSSGAIGNTFQDRLQSAHLTERMSGLAQEHRFCTDSTQRNVVIVRSAGKGAGRLLWSGLCHVSARA